MKINGYLLKSTVVAALGGLLFGFDTAAIAGTTHSLTEVYHLSPGYLPGDEGHLSGGNAEETHGGVNKKWAGPSGSARENPIYFVTSAMNTPKGSSVTSWPFADDCGVAMRLFRLAEEKPLSAKLNVAFCGDADMFSATSTALPL